MQGTAPPRNRTRHARTLATFRAGPLRRHRKAGGCVHRNVRRSGSGGPWQPSLVADQATMHCTMRAYRSLSDCSSGARDELRVRGRSSVVVRSTPPVGRDGEPCRRLRRANVSSAMRETQPALDRLASGDTTSIAEPATWTSAPQPVPVRQHRKSRSRPRFRRSFGYSGRTSRTSRHTLRSTRGRHRRSRP